jgi:hypothetical protein
VTAHSLSLREIARRLDLPQDTVASYAWRFSRFIPPAQAEALTVFREIRAMFNRSWTAEEIERELAEKFQGLADIPQPDMGEPDPRVVEMARQVRELLDQQTELAAECRDLRQEVEELRRDRDAVESRYADNFVGLDRVAAELRDECAGLRAERDALRRRLDRLQEELKREQRPSEPPQELLALPLVIRARSGDYLGVVEKDRHFSLADFIGLIESGPGRTVLLRWQGAEDAWTLHVQASVAATGKRHSHSLAVRTVVTPRGNRVVRLTRLMVDGNSVPDALLLALFRKIKDFFAG